MKKKRGLSFNTLLLLFALVPMLVAVIVNLVYSVNKIGEELETTTYEKLMTDAKEVQVWYQYDLENDNLSLDASNPDDTEFIDSLKEYGVELTLFQDDTRVMTSIKDSANETGRNIGTKAGADIYATVKAGNTYTANGVVIDGEEYYVCYLPVYDKNGSFWGMAFSGESQATVDSIKREATMVSIAIAVVLSLVFVGIAFMLARKVSKPLAQVAGAMLDTSKGDLNANTDISAFVNETNELIEAAQILQNELRQIIGKTKDISTDLVSGAASVAQLSETSTDGANQISAAIDDLAHGATSMAENVQSINAQVIEMGYAIDSIAENADVLVQSSNSIKEANREASDYIDKVSASSIQSVGAVQNISQQIAETNTAVNNIKEAVNMIASIASQTNLLALNASIEAARAGEAGKGFAVVATEIKSLSEQTNGSTEQIKAIVDEIVEKSEKSVKLSEEVAEIITKEQEYIQDTQDKFELLNSEIGSSLDQIESITGKITTLNDAKYSITSSVSDLSAISEENAASNQEVAASVSGIVAAINDIADNSKQTNEFANNLTDTVGYFG